MCIIYIQLLHTTHLHHKHTTFTYASWVHSLIGHDCALSHLLYRLLCVVIQLLCDGLVAQISLQRGRVNRGRELEVQPVEVWYGDG